MEKQPIQSVAPPVATAETAPTGLRDLVGHRTTVQATELVGQVYAIFAKHGVDFIAVLDGERLLGMCGRREVGMLLGARFGFALYAEKPIREHLLPEPTTVIVASPLPAVLGKVSARSAETYYNDVLLVDGAAHFLGLISMQALVRLQHRLLTDNIRQLKHRQRELSAKNEQIEADLRMARQLQDALVTSHVPVFPPEAVGEECRLRFQHRYLPCGTVGGDLFHVMRVADLAAGVFIGDVMGHGIRSALMMAMLRGLMEELRVEAADPGLLLSRLNDEWIRILRRSEDELFATALYAVVDAAAGELRFATAGHPWPVLIRARAGTLDRPQGSADKTGPMLGLFEQTSYATCRQSIAPGDRVMFFTDGLYGVQDAEGTEFGQARLQEAFGRYGSRGLAEMIEAVLAEACWFSPTSEFGDDVCLVGVEVGRVGSTGTIQL